MIFGRVGSDDRCSAPALSVNAGRDAPVKYLRMKWEPRSNTSSCAPSLLTTWTLSDQRGFSTAKARFVPVISASMTSTLYFSSLARRSANARAAVDFPTPPFCDCTLTINGALQGASSRRWACSSQNFLPNGTSLLSRSVTGEDPPLRCLYSLLARRFYR